MRRLAAVLWLLVIGGGTLAAAALSAPAAFAAGPAGSGACQPVVDSYSSFKLGPSPDFTIKGSCFGRGGAMVDNDSNYFAVTFYPSGTPASRIHAAVRGTAEVGQQRWSACSLVPSEPIFGPDSVHCNISSWTPTSITLSSFGASYQNSPSSVNAQDFSQAWSVVKGDQLVVEIWNAQTGAGPATIYLTPGTPGTVANSTVGSIAAALPTPAKAFGSVKSDLVDLAITIGLVLFITFPANLFNATFQENYEDIVAWWEKWAAIIFPRPLRQALVQVALSVKAMALARTGLAGRSQRKRFEREKVTFGYVILAGALLGTMLDPAFGFNFRTILSFVSIVIAVFAGVIISGLITGGYHRVRKHGRVPYKLEALPMGLAVAAACVVISRISAFQPGYLYGVIAGISFTRKLEPHEEGHVVALGSWFKLLLAVLAWLAWAAITHDATKPGSFFGTVLLDDFLASLFVSSIVSQVISLLPLKFMPGHKLRSWHKGAWAATFLVTLFVLVQVMLRPHSTSSGPSHAPLTTAIALFALFAVGSIVFRDHFARKHRRLSGSIPAEGVITLEEATGNEATCPGAEADRVTSAEPVSSGPAAPAPERP